MWLIIFLIVIFVLILGPLTPAIAELTWPTDKEPLRVVQDYDINIKHFATGLKSYLEKNLPDFFTQSSGAPQNLTQAMTDETPFHRVGETGAPLFTTDETAKKLTGRLMVSAQRLTLPADMLYEAEIYSKSSITMGVNGKARALLAEGDIVIEGSGTILRWVHSNKTLYVANDFHLFGRASADEDVVIKGRGVFERISAGRIGFGQISMKAESLDFPKTPLIITDIAHVKDQFERRWLLEGNVKVPAGSFFDGDIVATKSVTIEKNSHIAGSIKSNKDMVLGAGVRVDGSIVSAGNIHIGAGCHIIGQVIAEGTIWIETDAVIGSETSPTTVNAHEIEVRGNLLVYGTVWADEKGTVTSGSTQAKI